MNQGKSGIINLNLIIKCNFFFIFLLSCHVLVRNSLLASYCLVYTA